MSECLDLLDTETLQVRRVINEGKYDFDTGLPLKAEKKEFTIEANVQNASAFQREQVVENDRESEVLILFSSEKLQHNDIVIREGRQYEVRGVEGWTQLEDLAHYEITVVFKDV